MDKFEELMKKSIIDSKEKFLKFVMEIYKINENVFSHLIKTPIIYETEELLENFPITMENEYEITEIFDNFIKKELSDKEICSINLEQIIYKEFEYEVIEEWERKIENGEIQKDYDYIIVYNEDKIKEKIERTENDIYDYLNNIILTELCLLNSNYLTSVSKNMDKSLISLAKNKEKLIEILVSIINVYQDGDKIEDCLYKALENKIKNKKLEEQDKNIFGIYIIAYDEIIEWIIYGAYSTEFLTNLNNKMQKIFEINKVQTKDDFANKILVYIENESVSEKQKAMIEILWPSSNDEKQLIITNSNRNSFKDIIDKIRNIVKNLFSRKKEEK